MWEFHDSALCSELIIDHYSNETREFVWKPWVSTSRFLAPSKRRSESPFLQLANRKSDAAFSGNMTVFLARRISLQTPCFATVDTAQIENEWINTTRQHIEVAATPAGNLMGCHHDEQGRVSGKMILGRWDIQRMKLGGRQMMRMISMGRCPVPVSIGVKGARVSKTHDHDHAE